MKTKKKRKAVESLAVTLLKKNLRKEKFNKAVRKAMGEK